jgi:Mor family transcriptional regulator
VTVGSAVPCISVSWLSEAAVKVKDIVGEVLWDKIVEAVGGSTIYVPVDRTYYQRRNRDILAFARNHTIRETAKRFSLSQRQVKSILSTLR